MSINEGNSWFTDEDTDRLEKSSAWKEQPRLIEALCRVLHDVDPMGLWSGENPHARTEYLQEATAIKDRSAGVRSEKDLANVLAVIFEEKFSVLSVSNDWIVLAGSVLPILEEFRA